MVREQRPLSELRTVMDLVPQVLESVKLPERRALSEMPRLSKAIGQCENKLGSDGRVLVRWSGTEPKLRLMLEGPKVDELRRMVSQMVEAAHRDLGSSS